MIAASAHHTRILPTFNHDKINLLDMPGIFQDGCFLPL